MSSSRGQATVDYVALVAVLAVVLVAGATLVAGGAPGIVNAVVGQVRHALCVVGGARACPDPRPRACTVATTRDRRHLAVTVALVRLDRDRSILRERLSDGTVRITVMSSGALGVEVGVGADARVEVRGRSLGAADEARAAAQAVLASGRVFVARDAREADALVRALRDNRAPSLPVREVVFDGGLRGLGSIGVGSSFGGASLEGLSAAMIGARRDRRSGEVTFALGATGSAWGALTAALGGVAGEGERATSLALTVDRRGRPTELTLSASGMLAAGATLPLPLPRELGTGWVARSPGGRRWELSARLDLRDPVTAAAWRRFRGDPTGGDAIGVLAAAIRERAQLDVRRYRANTTSSGAAAGVALGVRLGGEVDRSLDRSELEAAASRPAGGLWEPRWDCVGA